MNISSDTFLPVPPYDAVPDPVIVYWVTMFYAVTLSMALLYALFNIRKAEGRLMLLLMVAGAIASLCEPILDIMGAAWYPHIGIPIAFEFMGRPIPVWVVLAYTMFFGVLGWFTVRCFQRGVTEKQVWMLFLAPVAMDILQQEILLNLGLLMYYGEQPLVLISKFPFWWAPCDSFGNFLAAACLFRLLPYMKGWLVILTPLIYPLADFIGYAATALVGFNVVNTAGLPFWVNQISGLASWILAIPMVWLIVKLVSVDSPFSKATFSRTSY